MIDAILKGIVINRAKKGLIKKGKFKNPIHMTFDFNFSLDSIIITAKDEDGREIEKQEKISENSTMTETIINHINEKIQFDQLDVINAGIDFLNEKIFARVYYLRDKEPLSTTLKF